MREEQVVEFINILLNMSVDLKCSDDERRILIGRRAKLEEAKQILKVKNDSIRMGSGGGGGGRGEGERKGGVESIESMTKV